MHIGIAEDDPDQMNVLRLWLEGGQHTVAEQHSVAGFINLLKRERFELLVIDWMLPDGTGADVLQWARSNLGWELPILVLTARDDEDTVVAALQAGADDYVVKPPKPMELLARVTALGRRVRGGALPVLRLGAFDIDIQRQHLMLNGEPVVLTQKEFDLSVYLFQNPGKLLSRDHLLNKIWGFNADVDTRTVDTHISRLRKKLGLDGSNGWKLVPVYGVGYRFERTEAGS
jgi:two-component system, OmpR family, response regulator RegX3